MASVFEVLDQIRKRPSMYIGGDESRRSMQLENLEQLLTGYTLALRQHDIQEHVVDFNQEFGSFLWKTKGWSASCGPVAAIRERSATDEDAWELFWRLVDEFRTTVTPHER